MHERMVIVTIRIFDVPYVPEIDRVEVADLGESFWQVTVQYGFKDEPDLPAALAGCAHFGLEFDMMDTSFFLGRETLIPRLGEAWLTGVSCCSLPCSATPAVSRHSSGFRRIALSGAGVTRLSFDALREAMNPRSGDSSRGPTVRRLVPATLSTRPSTKSRSDRRFRYFRAKSDTLSLLAR